MRGPLVSVIVPVYNAERFLQEALDSVRAQDYEPVEIVVVDDGSEDGSAAVAKSFEGVRYVFQSNQGPSAARNAGIAAAGGEFIAFLDADDVMLPNKLRVQIGYLLEHPEIGCVLAQHDDVVEPGMARPAWLAGHPPSGQTPAFSGPVTKRAQVWPHLRRGGVSAVIRREVLRRAGDFDPDFRHFGDVEWLFRVWRSGVEIAVLPDILLRRRIHGANLTYRRRATQRFWLRFMKGVADRRDDCRAVHLREDGT
jgi:glycosyltransferase involved in cell wall biosynthesis